MKRSDKSLSRSWRHITKREGVSVVSLYTRDFLLIINRTSFDSNPKVGPKHIDLYRLYKRVVDEGGYDKVSDTKGNKLAWRRIASDFLPAGPHIVQLAFLVKTVYYKNLS